MKLKKEHIGQRLLVKEDRYMAEPVEAGLLEVSPSGKYIKIQFVRSDNTTYNEWVEVFEYELVEVLGSKMDQISDVIEDFYKEQEEKWKKAEDDFREYTSLQDEIPLYQTPDIGDKPYWEDMPKSFCKADREKAVQDFNETLKKTEQYAQELKKSNWVHGMCNPPSPDYIEASSLFGWGKHDKMK